MLPHEPIYVEKRAHKQIAFLVEMRSRAGFSGSPVFLLPQVSFDEKGNPAAMEGAWRDRTLGIVAGHFPAWAPIEVRQKGETSAIEGLIDDNSGMAYVIPAWRIQQVFDQPEAVTARKEEEQRIVDQRRHRAAGCWTP